MKLKYIAYRYDISKVLQGTVDLLIRVLTAADTGVLSVAQKEGIKSKNISLTHKGPVNDYCWLHRFSPVKFQKKIVHKALSKFKQGVRDTTPFNLLSEPAIALQLLNKHAPARVWKKVLKMFGFTSWPCYLGPDYDVDYCQETDRCFALNTNTTVSQWVGYGKRVTKTSIGYPLTEGVFDVKKATPLFTRKSQKGISRKLFERERALGLPNVASTTCMEVGDDGLLITDMDGQCNHVILKSGPVMKTRNNPSVNLQYKVGAILDNLDATSTKGVVFTPCVDMPVDNDGCAGRG